MGDVAQSIQPLPPHVAAQISSSTAIPSLTSVTLGLLANSLDAEAQKIQVSVDFSRGIVSVEDDGCGIPPKEFFDSGGLGKLHRADSPLCSRISCLHSPDTSKYNVAKGHIGCNGAFLASVAALSILSIVSHHQDHIQHASLTLHHSRPAARLIPAPAQHLMNREHGTRVSVHNLFGNMPVRVRQRAMGSIDGEVEKQLGILKRQVVGLLLAWHRPVSVSVKFADTKKEWHLHRKGTGVDDGGNGHLMKNLDLSLTCGTLSQFGYIDPSDWRDWVKTSARTPFITIKGAISLRPAPSKHVQFISLGLRPINSEKGGNVIYDEINRLFASSSFGNQEDTSGDEGSNSARRRSDRRFKQDGFTVKQLKGEGKGVDRWPMFYIHVEMHRADHSRGDDFEKLGESTLTGLLKVLDAMVLGFLNENHFRPRARPAKRKYVVPLAKGAVGSSAAPAVKTPPINPMIKQQYDTYNNWSRVKVGTHINSSGPSPSSSSAGQQPPQSNASVLKPAVAEIRHQVDIPISDTPVTEQTEPHPFEEEQHVEWINPVTGARVQINSRTGLVIDGKATKRSSNAPPNRISLAAPSTRGSMFIKSKERLGRAASLSHEASESNSWSDNLLKTWQNPVFDTTEQPIPQVSIDGPSLETSEILHGRPHCCSHTDIQKAFAQSSSSFSAKLSKQSLKDATVIAQVDRKFVLLSVPKASELGDLDRQILVLVDQHATDERIRVETLFAGLQSDPTVFAKPIIFEISSRERELLAHEIPFFTAWGIVFDITLLPNTTNCRVTVKALPAAIAERCRMEPKLLIDLIRGEAWKRKDLGKSSKPSHENPALQPNSSQNPKNGEWLTRLSTCPQGLLDMLNSRACRSAIMFNDVLSVDECTTLVRRLADCAFPFQCAHGRPSMVPLVDLGESEIGMDEFGGGEGGGRGEEEQMGSFGEAWRAWRGGNEEEDVEEEEVMRKRKRVTFA